MKCPRCKVVLVVGNRAGIWIDACGQCDGVWLGRGEVEKYFRLAQKELNEHEARLVRSERATWFRSLRGWLKG